MITKKKLAELRATCDSAPPEKTLAQIPRDGFVALLDLIERQDAALRTAKETIEGTETDTIWLTHHETLVDRIDAALIPDDAEGE